MATNPLPIFTRPEGWSNRTWADRLEYLSRIYSGTDEDYKAKLHRSAAHFRMMANARQAKINAEMNRPFPGGPTIRPL